MKIVKVGIKVTSLLSLIFLISCGPSQEELDNHNLRMKIGKVTRTNDLEQLQFTLLENLLEQKEELETIKEFQLLRTINIPGNWTTS